MKLLATVFTLFATTATAQVACQTREYALNSLQNKFGERRQSIGLDHKDRLMEIFVNPETRSWTIVITTPDGTSCAIASGKAYDVVPTAPINTDPAL